MKSNFDTAVQIVLQERPLCPPLIPPSICTKHRSGILATLSTAMDGLPSSLPSPKSILEDFRTVTQNFLHALQEEEELDDYTKAQVGKVKKEMESYLKGVKMLKNHRQLRTKKKITV